MTRILWAHDAAGRLGADLGPALREALLGGGTVPSLRDAAMRDTFAGHVVRARALPDDPRWQQALDAGVTADGAMYITMSWLEGAPLDTVQLGDVEQRRILLEVAAILAALHARGVVHGDIKAGNLVWEPLRGVGIIDVETMRQVRGPFDPVATPAATKNWAAPEQQQRQQTVQASDLWAWGVLAERVWTDGLPPVLAFAVPACKRVDPFARPTAASLHAYLLDPYARLVDARGQAIAPDSYSGAGTTRRVRGAPEPTDRAPRVSAGPEPTDRVPKDGDDPSVLPAATRTGASHRMLGFLAVFVVVLGILVHRRFEESEATHPVQAVSGESPVSEPPETPVAAPMPPTATTPAPPPLKQKVTAPARAVPSSSARPSPRSPAPRATPVPPAPLTATVVRAPTPTHPAPPRPRADRSTAVHFARGAADVDADTWTTIRSMARTMNERPGSRLLVEGLSDGRESDPALAYARAEAVRDALVELGVAPLRLHLTSSGVRDLEFDEADSAANRRVDLFLRE